MVLIPVLIVVHSFVLDPYRVEVYSTEKVIPWLHGTEADNPDILRLILKLPHHHESSTCREFT
jgi:hypothetical protein